MGNWKDFGKIFRHALLSKAYFSHSALSDSAELKKSHLPHKRLRSWADSNKQDFLNLQYTPISARLTKTVPGNFYISELGKSPFHHKRIILFR